MANSLWACFAHRVGIGGHLAKGNDRLHRIPYSIFYHEEIVFEKKISLSFKKNKNDHVALYMLGFLLDNSLGYTEIDKT